MTEIVCLANSRKLSGRCIAGIDLSSGTWVRPVYKSDTGEIPNFLSKIEGIPIKPLEVIDIPLSSIFQEGIGYEIENKELLDGEWRRVGKKSILDILPFCEDYLIHDRIEWKKKIPHKELINIPLTMRRSLQLVYSDNVRFSLKPGWIVTGQKRWRASFDLTEDVDISVTDDEIASKLNQDECLKGSFLFTLSFGQPFWKDQCCYRLVASALPLQENEVLTIKTDRILKSIGWSEAESRTFLEQKFNKRSRRELTITEFRHFYVLLTTLI